MFEFGPLRWLRLIDVGRRKIKLRPSQQSTRRLGSARWQFARLATRALCVRISPHAYAQHRRVVAANSGRIQRRQDPAWIMAVDQCWRCLADRIRSFAMLPFSRLPHAPNLTPGSRANEDSPDPEHESGVLLAWRSSGDGHATKLSPTSSKTPIPTCGSWRRSGCPTRSSPSSGRRSWRC